MTFAHESYEQGEVIRTDWKQTQKLSSVPKTMQYTEGGFWHHQSDMKASEAPPVHRSLYERAFGCGAIPVDLPNRVMPAPWPHHGDLLDERDAEDMLYRRQMAIASQDRASR